MKTVLAGSALAAALLVGTALPSFADVITGDGMSALTPARLSAYGDDGTIAFARPTLTNPQGLVTEGKGAFTYNFYFQLDSVATLTGVTASSSTTYRGVPNLAFNSFAIVGLFGDMAPNTSSGYFPGVSGKSYTLAANTTYDLVIKGNVSNGTGRFNGNLSVSAVPLPTSVAMFGTALLGLGAFGAIRRKKEASAAVA